MDTRPTSDRLRETLFNVLAPRIQGSSVLDLYAGSGAVGLEALSRAASRVEFVEKAPPALAALKSNLARLAIAAGYKIHPASVAATLRRLKSAPFDLVFLDPPYDAAEEYTATLNFLGSSPSPLLAPHALVIAEHRKQDRLEDRYGALARTRLLVQGDAALSFYALDQPNPDSPSSTASGQS